MELGAKPNKFDQTKWNWTKQNQMKPNQQIVSIDPPNKLWALSWLTKQTISNGTKPNEVKPNQLKPNKTKPNGINQTEPN
jgi:hypothetical protein